MYTFTHYCLSHSKEFGKWCLKSRMLIQNVGTIKTNFCLLDKKLVWSLLLTHDFGKIWNKKKTNKNKQITLNGLYTSRTRIETVPFHNDKQVNKMKNNWSNHEQKRKKQLYQIANDVYGKKNYYESVCACGYIRWLRKANKSKFSDDNVWLRKYRIEPK